MSDKPKQQVTIHETVYEFDLEEALSKGKIVLPDGSVYTVQIIKYGKAAKDPTIEPILGTNAILSYVPLPHSLGNNPNQILQHLDCARTQGHD